jgi:YbbR domain-containing protein
VHQRNRPQWRSIRTPLALAIVSLATAIALWVAVTDAENPNRVGFFNGVVEVRPVNVPQGQAVASIQEAAVRFRIRADEQTFNRLTAADFRAEVDLAGMREPQGELVVLPRVIGRRDVEVIEALPPVVTVRLEQSATRQIPVHANLVGSPAQGFAVTSVEPSPGTVRVTGAQSLVQLASQAAADVNLTGLRVNLQQQFSLTARDARGADLRNLTIEPANVDIRVQITQLEVTLGLTVVPQVQGTVADGYNLVSISSDPPAIAVTGPLELLQALPYVSTEAVDVSGLRAGDTTRSVRIRLPLGLQTNRDSVSVRLRVVPAQGEVSLTTVPQVTGVAENLRATLQAGNVNLRLSGELPTLRSLTPAAVRATVNASGLEEGVHVLRPAVSVPDGVQVLGIDPAQVVVVLQRR